MSDKISEIKEMVDRLKVKSFDNEEDFIEAIHEFKSHIESKYGCAMDIVKVELGGRLITQIFTKMLPELEAKCIVLTKTAREEDAIFIEFANTMLHVLTLLKKVVLTVKESDDTALFDIINSSLKLIGSKLDMDLEREVNNIKSFIPQF